MTFFWEVTSSAEEGSSAISTLGPRITEVAITVRCFIPPESSTGYLCNTFAGKSQRAQSVTGKLVDRFLCSFRIMRVNHILNKTDTFWVGLSAFMAAWGI
jgi:hypothetical protein